MTHPGGGRNSVDFEVIRSGGSGSLRRPGGRPERRVSATSSRRHGIGARSRSSGAREFRSCGTGAGLAPDPGPGSGAGAVSGSGLTAAAGMLRWTQLQ
jgi:hypothetical protein